MKNTFLCVPNEKIYNAVKLKYIYKMTFCAFLIKRFIVYLKS